MTIYKVDRQDNNYVPNVHSTDAWGWEVLSNQGPDYRLQEVLSLPFEYVTHLRSRKRLKKVDIYLVTAGVFAFSDKAATAVGPLLRFQKSYFSPINCEGDTLYIVRNLPVIAAIDLGKSDVERYDDGTIRNIKHYVFDPVGVGQNRLFKDIERAYTELYCADEFKEVIESAKLSGLQFLPLDSIESAV